MKNIYEKPSLKVVNLQLSDVITTSLDVDGGDPFGEDDGE